ncbi:MAG: ABC transporter permease subunit [Kiritimatiellia bacterium]
MPIISKIGRKSLGVRTLISSMYFLLALGGTSMLYPFLLMIAGSTKSNVDTPDADIIPAYLREEHALYQKDAEAYFNEALGMLHYSWLTAPNSFRDLDHPPQPNPEFVGVWRDFLESGRLDPHAALLGHMFAPRSQGVMPSNLRLFKKELNERFNGDIEALNETLSTDFSEWNTFYALPNVLLMRTHSVQDTPFYEAKRAFRDSRPTHEWYVPTLAGFYRYAFLSARYGGREIENYNRANGTPYTHWNDIPLPRQVPDIGRRDWLSFTRTMLNANWIRADQESTPAYREYLKAKYLNIPALNRAYRTDTTEFSAIQFPVRAPADGLPRSDWENFLEGWEDPDTGAMHQMDASHIHLSGPEFSFQNYLRDRFGHLETLNAACGTAFRDWDEIMPPQQETYALALSQQTKSKKIEYSTRNFITVVDYVVLHGRAVINTVIYCVLAVMAALIINPLAAYALSRYKPPSAYKVLLFLMLTMAFPPMVTQIPVFLMLRDFHLLNTFWALILPGLANGYSIFLLKGFFDSLPRELYESATIDGAGEFRIFWQITMSLSQPILAVIALQTFTVAYSNFMMALLICQDPRMWTLMPWLYQLQQRSGQGVIFTSLLVAAIPTFLIFVFCQNIIMRGIVVPVEK